MVYEKVNLGFCLRVHLEPTSYPRLLSSSQSMPHVILSKIFLFSFQLPSSPLGVVRPSNVCLDARASGLGNNWAMGFGACADDEAIFQGVQSGGGLGQPLRYHDGVRLVRREKQLVSYEEVEGLGIERNNCADECILEYESGRKRTESRSRNESNSLLLSCAVSYMFTLSSLNKNLFNYCHPQFHTSGE